MHCLMDLKKVSDAIHRARNKITFTLIVYRCRLSWFYRWWCYMIKYTLNVPDTRILQIRGCVYYAEHTLGRLRMCGVYRNPVLCVLGTFPLYIVRRKLLIAKIEQITCGHMVMEKVSKQRNYIIM